MYGMVNKALEEMVCARLGDAVWEEIKTRAGVDVDVFVSNDPYPDEMSFGLVTAAAEVTGLPAQALLEDFGRHWILCTAREGYGELLDACGDTLPEFLSNLPSFHTRIAMIFPKLQPPIFECTDLTEHSVRLHYRTHRSGLTAFLVGLLHGLGARFDTELSVTLEQSRDAGADHDVFLLAWP
ncbi:heme NO-binding protein [Methylolobus aquaticus]|nr:heme NO-binding protein [Methylolobus aquaticus]